MIRTCVIWLAILALTASTLSAQTPRLQTGGAGDHVEAADGLSADIFARRLGLITDMVRGTDGTLYLADRDGGRIMRIIDRNEDGISDLSQPLPHRFDGPGGLALMGETLFVSDRGGVWRIDPNGGTPVLIAPFASAGASDDPAPLILLSSGALRLGLNRADGTASLIDIDPVTGRAEAIEQTRGRILSFAKSAIAVSEDAQPALFWVVLHRDGTTLSGSSLSGAQPLPEAADYLWLDAVTGQALIGMDGRVRQARASFGGLSTSGTDILRGLRGSAGPMLADERGLFVAEPQAGRVWRLSESDMENSPPALTSDDRTSAETPETDRDSLASQPDLLRGSGIGQASTLGPASTMGPASTLPPAQSPTSPADDSPDQR